MKRINSVITGIALLATSLIGISTPAQGTPTVCAVGTGFAGGSGSNYNDPFQVSTPAQLAYLVTLDRATTTGKFYRLTQNIDFQGCRVANEGGEFSGNFRGSSYTVSNFFVTETTYSGLFSRATGAVIANLIIDNATVTGTDAYTGALAGVSWQGTLLNNITVKNSLVSGHLYVGGVSGAIWEGAGQTLSAIKVIDSRVVGERLVGGVAGGVSGFLTVDQVGAFGTRVERIGTRTTSNFGGLFGTLNSDVGNYPAVTLQNVGFRGVINLGTLVTRRVALLIGDNDDVTITAENLYAIGRIESGLGSEPSGLVSGVGTTNIDRSYVRGEFVSSSDGTTKLLAYPLKSGPGAVTVSYVDITKHDGWISMPAGVGRTTQEMKTATTYVNFAYTTGTAAVAAGSIGNSGWYFSSAIDGGFMALMWEYWGSPIVPCAIGRSSFNGVGSCLDAPAGNFVSTTGSFDYTPCPVGTFQANSGASECLPAPTGSYVALPQQTAPVPCAAGTYQNQIGQSACIPAQPGFFVANPGSISQDPCTAGTTSLATSATFCTPIAAAGYSGPMITTSGVSVRAGSTVNLLGAELSSVTGASIDGVPAVIVSKSSTSITLRVPEVSAGAKDLILSSGSGTLTVQGALRVVSGDELTTQTDAVSIKRIGNRVRLFATDVVGAGKIQFKINGKEVGWVRAVDETNPKLRNANGRAYFVRLAGLASGKNAVEIYVDGTRVKRVAYTR